MMSLLQFNNLNLQNSFKKFSAQLHVPSKTAGAMPFSPFKGGFVEVVVVVLADMFAGVCCGGSRGKLPWSNITVLIAAAKASME